jgi:hypothetical protein
MNGNHYAVSISADEPEHPNFQKVRRVRTNMSVSGSANTAPLAAHNGSGRADLQAHNAS